MSSEDARNALLLEGLNDMLSLGWIEQTVGAVEGKKRNDPSLVQSVAEAIQELLEADYAIAGNVVKDPANGLLMVKAWGLTSDATVERILRERDELDGPARGSLVWLELTDRGRDEAQKLDAAGCNPFAK